ncbi:winged helix-turn-helix domain-containing protein [Leclercia adecarboxylata]|uniref:winged helix-turn-helix domain-containing protein n=1 Tax=Leclercia adecarboxylata TaxID=83655 RepID=UPI002DB8FA35|nr:winged helix-turn-helix domain-containing protein [Leclercia adecarboxylata]MEB6379563.1 winged helix-turn-helix domain-containing protein [Leclercia adecarboxylata]
MTFNQFIINNEIIFDADSFELKPINSVGEVVVLNAPTSRCLQLLIEQKNEVVSRDDFLEQVWLARGIVVSQNTFYQNISLLRKSLKNSGLTEDIIITVRRKGFTLAPNTILQPYEDVTRDALTAVGASSVAAHPTKATSSSLSDTTGNQVTNINPASSESLLKVARWLVLLVIFLIVLEIALFTIGN